MQYILASILVLFTAVESFGLQFEKLTSFTDDALHSSVGIGYSAAIDGRTAIIGGYDSTGTSSDGAAYLFDILTGEQIAKFTSDTFPREREFGWSVAIGEGVAAVGVRMGPPYGAVYLYDSTTGEQFARLTSDLPDIFFGHSVAIGDDIVAVGAADTRGGGAVYLFDAHSGGRLLRIASPIERLGVFARSVAIDQGAVLATNSFVNGAGGEAYPFDISSGERLTTFVPDGVGSSRAFGWSADLKDGVALVGDSYADGVTTASGAAFLFDANTGSQIAKLTPDDSVSSFGFGTTVCLGNGLAFVGAPNATGPKNNSGAVYVFDAATGIQLTTLTPDNDSTRLFGRSLAFDDGRLVVGAFPNPTGGLQGGAFVYRVTIPEPYALSIALAAVSSSLAFQRR
jgi:hypothetical protein